LGGGGEIIGKGGRISCFPFEWEKKGSSCSPRERGRKQEILKHNFFVPGEKKKGRRPRKEKKMHLSHALGAAVVQERKKKRGKSVKRKKRTPSLMPPELEMALDEGKGKREGGCE